MSETYLPKYARRIVRELIEVVKPRKPDFDLPVEDEMLEFLDTYYSYFPFHMKLLFPMGLILLEYGTFIFNGWSRPFSKLTMGEKEAYIHSWVNSSLMLRRDLIKGVKGICLTAYYSLPPIMEHIGYDLPAHIERVNKGEPACPEACDFFREMNYDNNSRIPYPGYDRVDLTCHDTPPLGGAKEARK